MHIKAITFVNINVSKVTPGRLYAMRNKFVFPAAVSCPSGWIPDAEGNDCFKFTSKSQDSADDTWDESFCGSLLQDSELAVLENDNLVDLVKDFPNVYVYFGSSKVTIRDSIYDRRSLRPEGQGSLRRFLVRIDGIQWLRPYR